MSYLVIHIFCTLSSLFFFSAGHLPYKLILLAHLVLGMSWSNFLISPGGLNGYLAFLLFMGGLIVVYLILVIISPGTNFWLNMSPPPSPSPMKIALIAAILSMSSCSYGSSMIPPPAEYGGKLPASSPYLLSLFLGMIAFVTAVMLVLAEMINLAVPLRGGV